MKIPEILIVETVHQPGSLAKVLMVIAEAGLTIEHLTAVRRSQGRTVWEITLEIDEAANRDLYDRIDATIAHLEGITAADLDAAFDRPLVFEHRRGSIPSTGGHFLLAFAIPHFFYHVTTAYGILRNQGVPLTMGDFLGNWGAATPDR